MFWCFDELFSKRLQKVAQFVKKQEKSSIWPKLINFSNKLPCLCISINFSGKSCKKCLISWKTTRNHRFGQNYATFSNKLPCLCISINFSGKSCKKCLISWNSTKNHWFGQSFATFGTSYNVFFLLMNFQEKSCKKCVVSWKSTKNHRFCQLATSRENYHVLTFRWTLQQKVAKSCSCREKARKIINLAKSLTLFEQTSMFLHFDEFSRKKLPKALRFVKKHEKSSIWPKLCNFSSKLPCFAISMKFSAKSYKKCLVSSKSTKNHRFGQNLQLFEQTTMFWHFDELFRKKTQKVARFVKKHEHSLIWPKLATSRRNYHVLAFRWLLQEKVAKRWKKWLIWWKMTKNHRFGLNLQLLEETTMFRRFCQLFSKKWVISWKSTKNRHSEVA